MEAITLYPKTKDQLSALKALLKALDIPFEKSKRQVYDQEFVAKIKKSEKEYKNGEAKSYSIDDLKEMAGL